MSKVKSKWFRKWDKLELLRLHLHLTLWFVFVPKTISLCYLPTPQTHLFRPLSSLPFCVWPLFKICVRFYYKIDVAYNFMLSIFSISLSHISCFQLSIQWSTWCLHDAWRNFAPHRWKDEVWMHCNHNNLKDTNCRILMFLNPTAKSSSKQRDSQPFLIALKQIPYI